jgi:hypothetical protein
MGPSSALLELEPIQWYIQSNFDFALQLCRSLADLRERGQALIDEHGLGTESEDDDTDWGNIQGLVETDDSETRDSETDDS